jgi:nucleoside permease NupC
MERFTDVLGLLMVLALAYLFSTNRHAILAGTMANLMSASIVGVFLR